MAWTPWRKIADPLSWYPEHGLRMPVCFELGCGDALKRDEPQVVYCGATRSEARFMLACASGDSPLRPQIERAISAGQAVYLRSTGARDLAAAEAEAAARHAEPPAWNAKAQG